MSEDEITLDGVVEQFKNTVGEDVAVTFMRAVKKINAHLQLDLHDLQTFAAIEQAAQEIMGWTIVDPDTMAAIQEACIRLGVGFDELVADNCKAGQLH